MTDGCVKSKSRFSSYVALADQCMFIFPEIKEMFSKDKKSTDVMLRDRSDLTVFVCYTIATRGCQFKNIELGEENPYFHPATNGPDFTFNMSFVSMGGQFFGSRMYNFTEDVCDVIKTIEVLNANQLGLQVVSPNAFRSCRKILSIGLMYNNLTYLDPNTFRYNVRLQRIYLRNNKLVTISGKLFNNAKWLEFWSLEHNLLTEFPVKDFRVFYQTEKLLLHMNKLRDLNEVEMAKKFPNLRLIQLCPSPYIGRAHAKLILGYFNETMNKMNRKVYVRNMKRC